MLGDTRFWIGVAVGVGVPFLWKKFGGMKGKSA